MDVDFSQSDLEYLINHVAFPPKLPQEDDYSAAGQRAVTKLLLHAAEAFHDILPGGDRSSWSELVSTIRHAKSIHDDIFITSSSVRESLKTLKHKGTNNCCLLFILISHYVRSPHLLHTWTERWRNHPSTKLRRGCV